VKEEEDAFLKTLDAGIKLFNSSVLETFNNNLSKIIPSPVSIEMIEKSRESINKSFLPLQDAMKDLGKRLEEQMKIPSETIKKALGEINGQIAFKLQDTYGFPLDLTKLLAKEINIDVDEAGFEKEMQQQKQRSRAATAVDTDDWVVLDDYARNEFIGYDELESQTKVVKYRKVKAKGKEGYQLVLEVTPFYAESGGQVGDTGELIINNEKLKITDTKKDNDLIIHFTDAIPADLSGELIAKVDALKRKHTELHHSATHLVHAALRKY
jgi:alanyl-tRNA synthetase